MNVFKYVWHLFAEPKSRVIQICESVTRRLRLQMVKVGTSSSRMHVINHNWSATKQRLHPQSVAEIRLGLNRCQNCHVSTATS